MISLTHDEVLLFKILANFFGKERVLPRMSLLCVCGGELPRSIDTNVDAKMLAWSKSTKCLFTVVDGNDDPRLVVEFFSGYSQRVDLKEEEHQRLLKPILKAAGVGYMTIDQTDFNDLTNPNSSLELFDLLREHVEAQDSLIS